MFKQKQILLIAFSSILIYCLLSPAGTFAQTRRFLETGEFGAASTGHPAATAAAIKVLNNGGNAVDAAVCAAFLLGVVDFTNSGLGGDAFALVHLPDGKVIAFDASSPPPLSGRKNLSEAGLPTIPSLLLQLLSEFGTRSAPEILQPAIKTSIKGFKASAYLNQVSKKKLKKLSDGNAVKFLAPEGRVIQAGEIIRQPTLAQTLMQLARDHGQSFYRGEDAARIISHLQSIGSTYRLPDLAGFASKVSLAIATPWKNWKIYNAPPPSSSIAATKIALDLLEDKIEILNENPKNILEIAEKCQKIINFKYHRLSHYIEKPDNFMVDCSSFVPPEESSNDSASEDDSLTTHLCVWDKTGFAVSMTLTLGSHCGSGDLSPLGFFYNNEMKNFKKVVALYPDCYPTRTGPISSKAPLMLKRNDELCAILGGAGSDRIIFNVGLAAARIISIGPDALNFINKPRYFLDHQKTLHLEWTPDTERKASLQQLCPGLNYRESGDDYFGLLSAIFRDDNKFVAAGDFRRDGDCRAIDKDPQRPLQMSLNLYFSRKKGFDHLKLGGPINDRGQDASVWKSAEGATIEQSGDISSYRSKNSIRADVLSLKVKTKPLPTMANHITRAAFSQKPNFSPPATLPQNIKLFAEEYNNCETTYDLICRLMVDIGFAIPYRKVKRKTSADMLLEMGYGDCSGKARLMHEILQAYGAETRLVGGVIAGNRLKTSTHLWIEIKNGENWVPICPVNQYFGHIPTRWVKLRYGEMQTVEPGGKLIFSISEK